MPSAHAHDNWDAWVQYCNQVDKILDDAGPILQRLYDNDDPSFQEMFDIIGTLADQYYASGCDPIAN